MVIVNSYNYLIYYHTATHFYTYRLMAYNKLLLFDIHFNQSNINPYYCLGFNLFYILVILLLFNSLELL
jgi:hypothetical protein